MGEEYGPNTMGEGVVTGYSMPRLAHYTKHAKVLLHEFASHLVTIIRRTCLQLVTPSIQYFPVHYAEKTLVHLIRIKDGLDSGGGAESKFDFNLIKKQLARLQLVGQTLSNVRSVRLRFMLAGRSIQVQ